MAICRCGHDEEKHGSMELEADGERYFTMVCLVNGCSCVYYEPNKDGSK